MKKLKKALSGADNIYLTANSIAVVKVKSRENKYGGYTVDKKTRYIPKTSENLAVANSIYGTVYEKNKGSVVYANPRDAFEAAPKMVFDKKAQIKVDKRSKNQAERAVNQGIKNLKKLYK